MVGYRITNLETGDQLERRGDETFSTASLIKAPVLVALFDLAEKKQLTLDDAVVLTDINKVGGGAPASCSSCARRVRCGWGTWRG